MLRSSSSGKATGRRDAVASVGLPDFHFTTCGARELMHRMGHSTMRAALIYRHATRERDREIASAMDRRIAKQSGTKRGKKVGRKKKGERPAA